jgi:hypothetical protein
MRVIYYCVVVFSKFIEFESVCSVPQLKEGFVQEMKELKYCKNNVCHYKGWNVTQLNSICIVLESICVYRSL